MRRFLCAEILILFVLLGGTANAEPVQWPENSHYYEKIDAEINWAGAKAAAEAVTYMGWRGHLVTVNSAGENRFLNDHPSLGDGDANRLEGHWLGAHQEPGSVEPSGGWIWVTGEPFEYSNWWPGEPNNSFGTEDSVIFQHGFTDDGKGWNDVTGTNNGYGYIVEYEPPPPPDHHLVFDGFTTAFTVIKNTPTGALVDMDLGEGTYLLGFGVFGRIEGAEHQGIVLPEGSSPIRIVRDGAIEAYQVEVAPAFAIETRSKPGKVQLTWTHQEGIVRYDIYRSVQSDPDNFVKIAETTSTYSTYLDSRVTNNLTHLYAVAAVYDDREEFSNVAAATPSTARRPGNFAPVIYSTPTTEGYWAGSPYAYQVLAADSNGNPLTYTLSGAPGGMTVDNKGMIHWIPGPNQTGTFTFTVRVNDGARGLANQIITVQVSAPILTLVSLQVTPEEIYFDALDQSQQLLVTGLYQDGSLQDLTNGATGTRYRPDGSVAVRVNTNGVVTAQASGLGRVLISNMEAAAKVNADVSLADAEPSQIMRDAAAAIQTEMGGLVTVRWNPRNGTVASLENLKGRLSPESTEAPAVIAENFLLGHRDLFGLDNLTQYQLDSNYTNQDNGTAHITYRQFHEGIPFDNNFISVQIDGLGRVISVNANHDPQAFLPSNIPTINAAQAVLVVTGQMSPGTPYLPELISGPEGRVMKSVFAAGPFNSDLLTGLKWLSLADGVHLIWWTLFHDDANYCAALVDAHTGVILQVVDMAVAGIPGKAFTQDPDDTGNIPDDVYLPDEWFTPSEGKPYHSYGKNAYVVIRNGPTSSDYSSIIEASGYLDLFIDQWRTNGWGEMDSEGIYPDLVFTMGNAFYWVNHLHDYFATRGFDHSSRNIESGNYSLGDELRSQTGVLVYVRGNVLPKYSKNNSSAFYWTYDQLDTRFWTPAIQLGLWYTPFRSDGALSPDVVIHEYVHLVSNALVGGRGELGPMYDKGEEANSLSEAFSDFFACSMMNDPVFGEYLSSNKKSGMRIVPLVSDTLKYGDFKSLYKGSEYEAAMIFSTSLWELRKRFIQKYGQTVGQQMMENALIAAMKMMPSDPTFLDARNKLILAVQIMSGEQGRPFAWDVFAEREMGFSAKGPSFPATDLPPPEIMSVEPAGDLPVGIPLSLTLVGNFFVEGSRVYILDDADHSQEDVGFVRINNQQLSLSPYTFSHPGQFRICAATDYPDPPSPMQPGWRGDCYEVRLAQKTAPVIDQVIPDSGIVVGQPVTLEISGSNFTDIYSVTVVDPSGIEIAAGFTHVDASHITIPAHTFAVAGEHRIVLTSPSGQAEALLHVTAQTSALEWGMLAECMASFYWNAYRDDDITPEPWLGRNEVSCSASVEAGTNSANAQLLIPPGVMMKQSTLDILHLENASASNPTYNPNIKNVPYGGTSRVWYRDVINLYGIELSDGTIVTEGTTPCRLAIDGAVSITGDDYETQFLEGVDLAVVSNNTSLGQDISDFILSGHPDPLGSVEYYLDPLGTTGINVLSDPFDLPVTGKMVIFTHYFSSNRDGLVSGNLQQSLQSVDLDVTLMCDPNVKLIYMK